MEYEMREELSWVYDPNDRLEEVASPLRTPSPVYLAPAANRQRSGSNRQMSGGGRQRSGSHTGSRGGSPVYLTPVNSRTPPGYYRHSPRTSRRTRELQGLPDFAKAFQALIYVLMVVLAGILLGMQALGRGLAYTYQSIEASREQHLRSQRRLYR